MAYKYNISVVSDRGKVRDKNEDNFFVDGKFMTYKNADAGCAYRDTLGGSKHIFAVMDGMGGTKDGDKAANITAVMLGKLYQKKSKPSREGMVNYLNEFLLDTNDTVSRQSYSEISGTTLAMLYVQDDKIYAANVGDSRIYKYSHTDGTLKQISKDHTQAQMLYETGMITLDELRNFKGNNKLTQFLGMDSHIMGNPVPNIEYLGKASEREEYLIVSDGIYNMVGFNEIYDAFKNKKKNIAAYLARRAMENGAADNLTVMSIAPKKKKAFAVCAGLLALIVALGAGAYFMFGGEGTPTEPVDTSPGVVTPEPEPEPEKIEELAGLADEIEKIAQEVVGAESKVAYYIKNLDTGEVIEKNNSKMYSASLIKLFIAAEIYRQADADELAITDDINEKLRKMITISDNDSSNQLAEIAGRGDFEAGVAKITENAAALGCTYTVQKNDLQAVRTVPIPIGNFTSVRDCGIILEKVYNKELVSEEYSDHLLGLLKDQQRRSKIPKYIPSDVVIANKTGETSSAQNDVGIVYTDKCDYIICIMINDYDNSMDQTMDIVARISKKTYDYIMSDAVADRRNPAQSGDVLLNQSNMNFD